MTKKTTTQSKRTASKSTARANKNCASRCAKTTKARATRTAAKCAKPACKQGFFAQFGGNNARSCFVAILAASLIVVIYMIGAGLVLVGKA